MANIFFFGFERLLDDYLSDPGVWDITSSVFAIQTTTSKPRNGGSVYAMSASGSAVLVRSLGSNIGHLFFGCAFVYFSTPLPATPTVLDFAFMDGTTCQVGYVITSLGEIVVYRGNTTIASATELGRTATGVIVAAGTGGTGADYKMVEIEVVFATGATGSVVVRVADATVLTLSSVQTAASANAYANRLHFKARGLSWQCDDIYLNDDTGAAPENTFFGESFVVESCIPTGNGNSSQWVGSDGNSTDNYLLVDDNGNNDTDYVKSGTLNDIDTYGLGNLTNATGTIIGVKHYLIARKDDVATRTIASTIRTNATNYVGANKTMAGSYGTHVETRLINPDTSSRFTIAEVNALEAGQKVTT